jgi:hypothetical protein
MTETHVILHLMDLRALVRVSLEWIADFDRFENLGEFREELVVNALVYEYA